MLRLTSQPLPLATKDRVFNKPLKILPQLAEVNGLFVTEIARVLCKNHDDIISVEL
jgi:hypothetical protein